MVLSLTKEPSEKGRQGKGCHSFSSEHRLYSAPGTEKGKKIDPGIDGRLSSLLCSQVLFEVILGFKLICKVERFVQRDSDQSSCVPAHLPVLLSLPLLSVSAAFMPLASRSPGFMGSEHQGRCGLSGSGVHRPFYLFRPLGPHPHSLAIWRPAG